MSGRKGPLPRHIYSRFERKVAPYGDGRAPLSLSGWERILEIRKRRDKERL